MRKLIGFLVLLACVALLVSVIPAMAAPPTPGDKPKASPSAPNVPHPSGARPNGPVASPLVVGITPGGLRLLEDAQGDKIDEPAPKAPTDTWICSLQADLTMQPWDQDICPSNSIWLGAGAYWITASWDVNLDDLSTDIYGVFIGRLYVNGYAMGQEALITPNIAMASTSGPRPRVMLSRSWLFSSNSSPNHFQATGRKNGGNGWTKLWAYHTGMQIVQVK